MKAGFVFHGGRLAEARERFGGAAEDWLDLSTGINPIAWPGAAAMAPDWRDLPDPQDLRRLEARAAAHFGTDPAFCCAVPGSEIGLRLIAQILALPGLHLPLAYRSHAEAFASSRPLETLADLPAAAHALVIANPNNPDGRVTSPKEMLQALAHQEASGGWLIVDEAFADWREDWSLARHIAEERRLIVLRSFGKFFGLAGLRLGFVLAPLAIIARLRHLLGEWPVCSAALTYGAAAYDDSTWIAVTRRALPQRMARLDTVLERHGLKPQGECPLFRLVESEHAPSLFDALARQHILTRPFAAYPHLLRLGLPRGEFGFDRLDAALEKALAHG